MASYDDELSQIVAQLNRSAPGTPRNDSKRSSLDPLLALAARSQASDILLIAGSPVAMRIRGELSASGSVISAEDIRSFILPLLDNPQLKRLEAEKSLDLSLMREQSRFRVNLHYQRGSLAAAIRLLPSQIPTLESLNLPFSLSTIADRRQGLILVTGAAGSGKSSTLAALIGLINSKRRCHVVTIEDPVEYQHPNKNSIIEQIEIGSDASGFAQALRSILRQSPDVILVGEMRDRETMSAVLTAAETGHLVLTTLHTNDAPQAISRIMDSFPASDQPQIRQQISLALGGVVTQQLVPAATGSSRYPAMEIMMASDAVRNLVRKAEDHQLLTQISISRAEGMMTMEQSLTDLVRTSKITRDTAYAHCFRPRDLRRYLES